MILTSSTTSIKGTGAFRVHSATKAAVRNSARSWILDLKDRHIRVNVVSPGLTETAGLNDLFGGGEQAQGTKDYLVAQIPAGRVGQPEEIAKTAMFLASDDVPRLGRRVLHQRHRTLRRRWPGADPTATGGRETCGAGLSLRIPAYQRAMEDRTRTLPSRPKWRSPLENLLQWSANLSKRSASGGLVAIWLALFLADAATGRHVSLNGLYLLPLCATAWCVGTVPALVSGGIATGMTLWLNGFGDGLSAQASTIAPAVAAWNAGMRIFSVVFIVLLVSAFRRVFDREKADARIDPLTKLNNRRSFDIECQRLALSCARDGRILLCGLIDVDDFKSINDRHGHNAGDAVLTVLADALAGSVRSYDATARMGGDEFAFCMAVRNDEAAARKTRDIHRRISSSLEQGPWPATCSIGASTGPDVEDAFAKADTRLYEAKAVGKSNWRFASQPQHADARRAVAR